MPLNKDLKLIDDIAATLKNKYSDFVGIYFFGSRLRGDSSPDSDYDLLLVFNREISSKFKREIRDIIYDFMILYDVVIDTKIFSDFEMEHPNMPFTEQVKNTGYYYAV